MNRIRVLLANYPMMVPDNIRQLITEQEDMVLVGDCRGPMHILQETGRAKADAVILAQEGTKEPGLCSQLLSVYPDLIILSVAPDLALAFTQRLRSQRQPVANVHEQELLHSLRVAVMQHLGGMNG